MIFNIKCPVHRGVAQLVERLIWVQEAAGSRPVISTILSQSLQIPYNSV